MKEKEKHELILNIVNFYTLFQKEILYLMPDNNNSELSPLLFWTLTEIHFAGTVTSSELSKRLSISIPNTSRNVNRLVDIGYIVKIPDATDKRITHLRLSQKGFDLVFNSIITIEDKLLEKFNILDSNEIEKLSEAFFTLNDLIDLVK